MFKIVTGISGSGKTTYAKQSSDYYISFDSLFSYPKVHMDYKKLKKIISKHKENVVMDGFIFHYDAQTDSFISTLKPHDSTMNALLRSIKPHKLEIVFLYTSLEHLYECQISTAARQKRMSAKNMEKNDIFAQNRRVLLDVNMLIKNINPNMLGNKIDYIFRMRNKYKHFENDSHFLSLMGTE